MESVVWDVKNADERAQVPSMVVSHLLERHFAIGAEAIQTRQAQFDALLKVPEEARQLFDARGAAAGFKAALVAFDGLVKQMKTLDEELPLAILNVSPVSPALRYTDVFVPVAIPLASRNGLPVAASYLPVMEVVIEFEKSGRWPDDLRAIQKIKLAFLERLAVSLMAAVKGLHATVVLRDQGQRSDIQDEAALDIVTPEGWGFRARIWHDREATLLNGIIHGQAPVPKAFGGPLDALLPVFLRRPGASEKPVQGRLCDSLAPRVHLLRALLAPCEHSRSTTHHSCTSHPPMGGARFMSDFDNPTGQDQWYDLAGGSGRIQISVAFKLSMLSTSSACGL